MMPIKNPGTVAVMSLLAAACLTSAGCGGRRDASNVLASINDYHMTVEDFMYESKTFLEPGVMPQRSPVDKEEVLDALIDKEVLLQEAQRQDLDKRWTFMRTIEDYWEQTLLRDLMDRKTREIAGKTVIYDSEILDYYERMKTERRATVIVLKDEGTARFLAETKEAVKPIIEETSFRDVISYVVPSRWYSLGDGEGFIGEAVFGKYSGPGKYLVPAGNKWALILIEEERRRDLEPLSKLRGTIKEELRGSKEKKAIDDWIRDLRSCSRISINKNVLKTLP